ncbi:hypothetical protein AHAS_Ahas03G0378600 [Arachis hypogaea]
MHAELWGIICGLQISLANNFTNLMVKSDSLAAINFIKKGCPTTHPCAPLLLTLASLLDVFIMSNGHIPYVKLTL